MVTGMTTDCLFCKIVRGEVESDKVYEDEQLFAFNDIHPQAPIHTLIVPKKHIATIHDASGDDQLLLGQMLLTGRTLAAEQSVNEPGYRLVMNCNQHGGQTVFHIHLHLLAGRQLRELG